MVQLNNIASHIEKITYQSNEYIIQGLLITLEGQLGDSILIIKSGEIMCMKKRKEIRRLGQNDFLGETSVLFDLRRSLDVIALTDSVVYKISVSCLEECITLDYKNIIIKSIIKSAFSENPILQSFASDEVFAKVYSLFSVGFYTDGEVVINPNEKDRKIVYLFQGNLVCVLL